MLIAISIIAIIFAVAASVLGYMNWNLKQDLDSADEANLMLRDHNSFVLDELASEQGRSTRLLDKNTRLNNELTYARQEVSAANAATEEVRYQLSEALLRELPRLEELRRTPAKINTILSDEG